MAIHYLTSVILTLDKCGMWHGSTRRRMEAGLARNEKRSCWYAIVMLDRQRFLAGEPAIAKDRRLSTHYYLNVINPTFAGSTVKLDEAVEEWRATYGEYDLGTPL